MATRAEAAKARQAKLTVRRNLGDAASAIIKLCLTDPAAATAYGFTYHHDTDSYELTIAVQGATVRALAAENTGQQRAGPTASPHPLGSKAEEVRSRTPEADAQA